MIGVAVLGSTGSVGQNTLDVLARHPDRFQVTALGARTNVDRLAAQCARWQPRLAAMADADAAAALARQLRATSPRTEVLAGEEGVAALAGLPDAPYVMAAIVGAAGLRSTLVAAGAGHRLMIANKEPLVMAGELLLRLARASGATILPIDSEHNAIFQCLPPGQRPGIAASGVRRILLTASGGPFLRWSAEQIANATPEQACAHPNWVMGRKISVDSATLMNKGLEVIEARMLFGLPLERIEILVHRQSLVHSMVEYVDGSILAQLGAPDMRTPIAHALAWPERLQSGVASLDLVAAGRLEFEAPDLARFPCLRLARLAAEEGGLAPAVLNAANEVAVAAFLQGRVNFPGIAAVIEAVLAKLPRSSGEAAALARPDADASAALAAILAADAQARALAEECVSQLAPAAAARRQAS